MCTAAPVADALGIPASAEGAKDGARYRERQLRFMWEERHTAVLLLFWRNRADASYTKYVRNAVNPTAT